MNKKLTAVDLPASEAMALSNSGTGRNELMQKTLQIFIAKYNCTQRQERVDPMNKYQFYCC